jgi:hypothetical protein
LKGVQDNFELASQQALTQGFRFSAYLARLSLGETPALGGVFNLTRLCSLKNHAVSLRDEAGRA